MESGVWMKEKQRKVMNHESTPFLHDDEHCIINEESSIFRGF